ncbi:MAG: amino acid transporter [Parachlamydiales bacterium]|nr:amino acid transporter [Parachlamydiales bacterium]
MKKQSRSDLWGAIFLIAGTSIGGGMLALPLDTGQSGYIPSMIVMILTYLFMLFSGLLLAEANLWCSPGSHIMTMTKGILGKTAVWIVALVFLFNFYTTLVAYIVGGGSILQEEITYRFFDSFPRWGGALIYVLLFGFIIYLGTRKLEKINELFFLALVIAYAALIVMGIFEVRPILLLQKSWSSSLWNFPIMVAVFSYQAIIPSLTPYLNRDPKIIHKAITYGTLISLIIFTVWQTIILGIIPNEGEYGLKHALMEGRGPAEFMKYIIDHPLLVFTVNFFSFFSITTSFFGISLAVFDFLADGLSMKKEGWRKLLLVLMVIIPPLIFAFIFPKSFETALEISASFGDTIIIGILPPLLVFVGRYILHKKGPYMVKGGKTLLITTVLFFIAIMGIEILKIHNS